MMIKRFYSALSNMMVNKYLLFLDQALYALFNFGSIFALSRLAPVNEFGSYIIFISSINFVFIFSTFFLSAPILVLLPKKWKGNKGFYISSILGTNLILNVLLSLVCFFFLDLTGEEVKPQYVIIAPILLCTFDILKKYLFSSYSLNLSHAVIASFLLNAFYFIGIYFYRAQIDFIISLNVFVAALFVANLYLLCVFGVFKVFKTELSYFKTTTRVIYQQIITQHFNYSKWIIIGGIGFWGYSQGLFIMSKSLNISDFGISKVRTIQNILGIINIFIISIENYYIPFFANYIKENPNSKLDVLVKKLYRDNYKKVFILILLAFVFSVIVYDLFYGTKYGSGVLLIMIFSLVQLLLLFIRPISISLKAIEVTYPFFIAHGVAFAVMVSFGAFVISTYGYVGMALSFLLSNISYSLILVYFYRKKVIKNKVREAVK